MKDTLTVSAVIERSSVCDAPIAVRVTIKNVSTSDLEVLLPYPPGDNLRFTVNTSGARLRPASELSISRTAPVKLRAQESYSQTYFLNRYYVFDCDLNLSIQYSLDIVFYENGNPSTQTFSGVLNTQILPKDIESLKSKWKFYTKNLNSSNLQTKNEAIEALRFADNLASIPFLKAMLSVDGAEVAGIKALGGLNTTEANISIKNMLTHRESAVVTAAIFELDKNRASIDRTIIINLLLSKNASIRLAGLEHLMKTPSQKDIPFLTPLLNDINPVVKAKSFEYKEQLGNY